MALAERELKETNEILGDFDSVFKQYERMAHKITNSYYRAMRRREKDFYSVERDDIFQVACMAMFIAYSKYSYQRIKFTTYLWYTMNSRIRKFLHYKAEMIHIPLKKKTSIKYKVYSYNRKGEINGNAGEHRDESEKDLDAAVIRSAKLLTFEDDHTAERVIDFLSGLEERHAQAVAMRMEFYTMEEVGDVLGTSRQRVHQMINKVREEYLFYEIKGRHRKRGEKLEVRG